MNCPACGAGTLAEARFCLHCGTRLEATSKAAGPAPDKIGRGATTRPRQPARAALAHAPESGLAIDQLLPEHYRVERELGIGGMGAVHLVRDRATDRRFAVKSALIPDAVHRQGFLNELQTWIDLPEHQNLVTCRFFRAVADQVLIFADYADGGSLADAIVGGKLTRLEPMLDVAIQFAWGLHAAHEVGVVHRDVKPANVLRHQPDIVKITDFGISSARALTPQQTSGEHPHRADAAGAMTLPYRSPEQAAGKPLDRATDLWSWGVSVLELFSGERTWALGEVADEVLNQYLTHGPGIARRSAMPPSLADVLRRCFRHDPAERWSDMLSVTHLLIDIYREVAGHPYPREIPEFSRPPTDDIDHGKPLRYAGRDARHWHRVALAASRCSPDEEQARHPRVVHSQAARIVEELIIFDEARRLLERLIERGQHAQRTNLAKLCIDEGFALRLAGDHDGALGLLERGIALIEKNMGRGEESDELALLMLATVEQGRTLAFTGRLPQALAVFDHAIHFTLTRWRPERSRMLRDYPLAQLYVGKGGVCFELRDYVAAGGLFERASDILEDMVAAWPRPDFVELLCTAYRNHATAVSRLGDVEAAMRLSDRAIESARELRMKHNAALADQVQADALMDRAVVLDQRGDKQAALGLCERALERYRRLVEDEGQHVLMPQLAKAYGNLALMLRTSGDLQSALDMYDRGVRILTGLVRDEGRRDLEGSLMHFMLDRAIPLRELGRYGDVIRCLDDVIAALSRQGADPGRIDLRHRLALAYTEQAYAFFRQNDLDDAETRFQSACLIWRELIDERGRTEFNPYLQKAESNLRNLR